MDFDPELKESQLVAQAESWDTSQPLEPEPNDIPVIDVSTLRSAAPRSKLGAVAAQLRQACEQVGFFQLVGHGVSQTQIDEIFEWARRFHELPLDIKQQINIDNPDHSLAGVGYLPLGERRLPRRAVGNSNEAFLIKSGKGIGVDDNQWLAESLIPGFRAAVERYAQTVETVALELVTVFAAALDLDPSWFDQAMESPFWRLRLTRYPTEPHTPGSHGIAPHVDTTFFTLLLQDSAGLVVFSAKRGAWIRVPVVAGAFVVNTGELLRQWSNDRFLSARHFADNVGAEPRYSIPLFFNADGDWPMECLPTCHSPDNPPKYPAISYHQSQAVVQGE